MFAQPATQLTLQQSAEPNHRQRLIHCQVSNNKGNRSERFVDHSIFSLWQFQMRHRHQLNVSKPLECVWVPEETCRRHDRFIKKAAFCTEVARLTLSSFADDSGQRQERVRFVPEKEFAGIRELLLHHLEDETDVTYQYELGYAIAA